MPNPRGNPVNQSLVTSSPTARRGTVHLRLTRAAEAVVRSGHPWVFDESIRDQNKPGAAGDLAVIFDRHDRFLAFGLLDPGSPIRVRILHLGSPQTADLAWWRSKLEGALSRRHGLFDQQTTGYRLIHGENDGWPGLVLDRYGATGVLKCYTAAWFPYLRFLVDLLQPTLQFERIVLRLSRNLHSPDGEGKQGPPGREGEYQEGQIMGGPAISAPIQFLETGLRFAADVERGQKTGFFLDQRENRRIIEKLARGRAVLNAFSFSGGFSLYAARGGAASVIDLDLSAFALEAARRNFSLNREAPAIRNCRYEQVKADAFSWLKTKQGPFDLVILDPPSLARRAAERVEALRAYETLAAGALRTLRADGILVAASCSAQVRKEDFFQAILKAVRRSGRQGTILQTTGHPADHPVGFKEGEYLKCIYLRVR